MCIRDSSTRVLKKAGLLNFEHIITTILLHCNIMPRVLLVHSQIYLTKQLGALKKPADNTTLIGRIFGKCGLET